MTGASFYNSFQWSDRCLPLVGKNLPISIIFIPTLTSIHPDWFWTSDSLIYRLTAVDSCEIDDNLLGNVHRSGWECFWRLNCLRVRENWVSSIVIEAIHLDISCRQLAYNSLYQWYLWTAAVACEGGFPLHFSLCTTSQTSLRPGCETSAS